MGMGIKILIYGNGMGNDQWEWDGMRILIVFPHTFTVELRQCTVQLTNEQTGTGTAFEH